MVGSSVKEVAKGLTAVWDSEYIMVVWNSHNRCATKRRGAGVVKAEE
jgi:hypothetical protein